jgi:hypothetical protein
METKVYYRVHNSPPLVPINSQLNPVQAIQPYFGKIHFNSLGLSSGRFLSGFPTKTLYSFLFSPYVPHAPTISSSLISWPY